MAVAAPGRMVSVDGRRMHAVVNGEALPPPTVVLDAALGGSSLGWHLVLSRLQGRAPVAAYDRAGMGWSDAGPRPRTLDRQARELRLLLAAIAARPPFLWTGHSYGSLVARYCASLFAAETAGLVLVDPPELAAWSQPDAAHRERLERGVRLARRGVWAARCGIASATAWLVSRGALRVAAASAAAVSGGSFRAAREFNFAPARRLPAELQPAMRWIWTQPRFYEGLAAQMETLPETAAEVATLPPLGDIPLIVLSAADTPASQLAEHRAMAAANRGAHRSASRSGHWIPLEDPELITDAITELLDRGRRLG